MGLDFYRKASGFGRKIPSPRNELFAHHANQRHLCSTMNGAEFFKEHNFLIGLSLDGPRELHDIYRLDKGRATHL